MKNDITLGKICNTLRVVWGSMWRKGFIFKYQVSGFQVPGTETMTLRQDRILRVLSSIAVGIMAFCLTVPAAMLFGGILFRSSLESDVLFPPHLVILISVSILVGIAVGILAGRKYYGYLGKKLGR